MDYFLSVSTATFMAQTIIIYLQIIAISLSNGIPVYILPYPQQFLHSNQSEH